MKINDIVVNTVDNKKLTDFLAISLNSNEKLYFSKFCVYEDKFGIDIDCCFWNIENKHIDNKIQPVIDIECRIKKYTDGIYSIRMDKPDFTKTITLEDYLKLSSEIKLTDFIRYNYNPRIIYNQNLLIKYINNLKQ